ncbi:MAG: hypothetical protein R2712_09305 [Vicinamibacterales bacterium]
MSRSGIASASLAVFSQPLRKIEPMLTMLTGIMVDAAIVDRRVCRVAGARADAHRANLVLVHEGLADQVVDDRTNVFGGDRRLIEDDGPAERRLGRR